MMPQTDADQLLDRIVIALRDEPIPEFIEPATTVDLIPLARTATQTATSGRFSIRRRPSLRWLTAGATLALLSMFAIAFMTAPVTHPGVAFGQVQQAASTFKSLRYRCLDFHGDQDPYVSTVVSVRGVGCRSDGPGGSETITNWKDRRMLYLDHRARKATLYQMYTENGQGAGDEFEERMRDLPRDARESGQADFNGKKVLQFTFTDRGEYVVLADPDTKRPLRMELKLDKGLPGNRPFRELFADFLFDAPVSESTFKLDIPPGYKIERCEEPRGRKPVDTRNVTVSPQKGVGPVRMGASKDEVLSFFGAPDWVETRRISSKQFPSPGQEPVGDEADVVIETLHYNSLGFSLNVSSAGGLIQFRCLPPDPISRKFPGKTDRGIQLGASIDDVIKAYGAPEVKSQFRQTDFRYVHQGWQFLFDDGKLQSFSVLSPVSDQIEVIDNGDGSFTQRVKEQKE